MTPPGPAVASLVARPPRGRPGPLPALDAVQRAQGSVSPGALDVIAAHLRVPASEVWGVATHYPELRLTPPGRRLVRVCAGVSCRIGGGAGPPAGAGRGARAPRGRRGPGAAGRRGDARGDGLRVRVRRGPRRRGGPPAPGPRDGRGPRPPPGRAGARRRTGPGRAGHARSRAAARRGGAPAGALRGAARGAGAAPLGRGPPDGGPARAFTVPPAGVPALVEHVLSGTPFPQLEGAHDFLARQRRVLLRRRGRAGPGR